VGVNVAVITDVPAPATEAELPFTEITEVVAEEYEKVPGVLEDGAVRGKSKSPNVFVTALHDPKVGEILLTWALLFVVLDALPPLLVTVMVAEIAVPISAEVSVYVDDWAPLIGLPSRFQTYEVVGAGKPVMPLGVAVNV
jgi:hypothetical protein